MKDRILRKYGIPILRIKTNESGEESRLRDMLNQILNPDEQRAVGYHSVNHTLKAFM